MFKPPHQVIVLSLALLLSHLPYFPAVIFFFSFSQNAFNISCIPENKNKILIFSKYSSSLSPTLLPTLCRLHFHTPQLCYSLGWLPSGCSLFSFAILLVSLSLYS
ncbi:hypothetical protein U0070_025427 [Myodes glareolus]|uniref:Secreted protein n=1 Tax=Myodes glareolus TaxID=447135 RepID=A0AAW0IY70_MYOGA